MRQSPKNTTHQSSARFAKRTKDVDARVPLWVQITPRQRDVLETISATCKFTSYPAKVADGAYRRKGATAMLGYTSPAKIASSAGAVPQAFQAKVYR